MENSHLPFNDSFTLFLPPFIFLTMTLAERAAFQTEVAEVERWFQVSPLAVMGQPQY
jgi:hypothetical protein